MAQGRDEMNTGGRVSFSVGQRVRILNLEGTISKEWYTVAEGRSDRNGLILLKEEQTKRQIKLNYGRVIDTEDDNRSPVIKYGDRFIVVCAHCSHDTTIHHSIGDVFECQKCGQITQTYWLGARPMVEATAEKAAEKTEKTEKTEKKTKKTKASTAPKAEKKAPKEPELVDFAALAKTPGCELWSKPGTFDHVEVEVQIHTLIYTGNKPRTLNFNTYNGSLGKKAKGLPLDEFLHDKPVKDSKKAQPWFYVTNLDDTRAKLTKKGYTKHS